LSLQIGAICGSRKCGDCQEENDKLDFHYLISPNLGKPGIDR
jgi:hypothetical protein